MFLFRDFTLIVSKEIRSALHVIYGVGWYKSILILSKVGLSYPFFLQNINLYYFSVLSFLLKGFVVSDVRIKRRTMLDITRLIDIDSYIGLRHKLTLPVHGQRTRSNANTQRSKRIRTSHMIKKGKQRNRVINARGNKSKKGKNKK